MPRTFKQLAFADRRTKGGKVRLAPGRKAAERPNVRHRARPVHSKAVPMHIVMRARKGLPTFRREMLCRALEKAFRTTRREDFRIVEYSVQDTHLHLIVEADDKDALARGMKSFSVRANRLFNAASGRKRGKVWGDRYHRTDLKTPRQVRNALVYCINNYKKHAAHTARVPFIDPCSSGPWFRGWRSCPRSALGEDTRPTDAARAYLLRVAWQKHHALIHPAEAPRPIG